MDGAEIAGKYIQSYLEGKISDFRDYETEMHRKFDKKWNISERLAVRKYIDDVISNPLASSCIHLSVL